MLRLDIPDFAIEARVEEGINLTECFRPVLKMKKDRIYYLIKTGNCVSSARKANYSLDLVSQGPLESGLTVVLSSIKLQQFIR